MTDLEIIDVVESERELAEDYTGPISTFQKNRKVLKDYYFQKLYGNEKPGMSQAVTSEVSDVVEGMLPNLLKLFFQGRNFGTFVSSQVNDNMKIIEEELEQRTIFSNWVFLVQNKGFRVFHDFLKDALLQYLGVVEVSYEEKTEKKYQILPNATKDQIKNLKLKFPKLMKTAEYEEKEDGLIDVTVHEEKKRGKHLVENVSLDSFFISKNNCNSERPDIIGKRCRKTRSDLIKMGFNKKIVEQLPADTGSEIKNQNTTTKNLHENIQNPSKDKSRDYILFNVAYAEIDADGDGVGEYYQIIWCDDYLLEKTEVDHHPFVYLSPIPMTNEVIGSCPASQIADIQFLKSELVRQGLNNIYATNFNRFLFNNRANPDHLFTVKHGGGVHVNDSMDVTGVVQPLPVQQQVGNILDFMQIANDMGERRTGVTANNQGLDSDSLNKTATGFKGIRDMSMMRTELIARHAALAGQRIFELIDANARKYQDEDLEIAVSGKPIRFTPKTWNCDANFQIDVGLGSGDRQEKIINLNNILEKQIQFKLSGFRLADEVKIRNTLDKLCIETGLKDVGMYFNDIEIPEQTLLAENEQLKQQLAMLQEQASNPLEKAALIEQQTKAFESRLRMAEKQLELKSKEKIEAAKLLQKTTEHGEDLDVDITKLEIEAGKNFQGGLTNGSNTEN